MQPHNVERLNFKINISGTYWDKRPQYSILINNQLMASGIVSGDTDEIQSVTFACELLEDEVHRLTIRLENKHDSDTVITKTDNFGGYEIERDMLLNIHSIEIDDIDLATLIWSESRFEGDDANRPVLKNCVNLGWNGNYILEFTCPFYLWLLEKL